MYCPNCAASIDGVKFCRSCGANVSLVPQALTGQLAEAETGKEKRQRSRHKSKDHIPPNIESAVTTFFSGLGLIIAAFAIMRYLPGGLFWGWVFIIPGLSYLGQGIGHYLRYCEYRRLPFQSQIQQPALNTTNANAALVQPLPDPPQFSAPTTSTLVTPTSVTEDTTRHLEHHRERD